MSIYTITWGAKTQWEIRVSGSKNAALPLIASTLFFETAELTNVPDISDVHLMKEILESLGAIVSFEKNVFTVDNRKLSLSNLKQDLFKKARATYYLIPPLLSRFGEVSLAYPGGCSIGKRPIDGIVKGLEKLGYKNEQIDETLLFSGKSHAANIAVNAYFSVGTTIILILAALQRWAETRIELAAYEPHVMNLIELLNQAGANITLYYDHTIIVKPASLKSHLSGAVIGDYIVSGTLIIISALTAEDYIDIHDARLGDLSAFLNSIEKMGVKFEKKDNDVLRVYRSPGLVASDIQTNIYPGFPTDLQSPTAILMSQAEGVSHIHEVLFEWRLNWLVELETMRGHIALMNPHQAMIFGKTPLRGEQVSSWDLRSGAAMLIAGMIASGTTELDNVSHIERGYENFVERLREIGAKIEKKN